MITRNPHKFDNLNWVVQVQSEGEPFLNLKGEETNFFHFSTNPWNPTYYQEDESFNYVDQALSIDSIQEKFSGPPHKNSLAPIPTTSFSISNLELWYHKICEINGDDLNTFEGAKVSIFMVNSLNPLVVWDSVQSQWFLMDGRTITQAPDPTIVSPNYPTNEAGYLIFTGTVEDIDFSTQTTTFNCLGISDRQNTKLGTLADPLALKKDRGQILPITFGDWSSEDDLFPVILDRNQNEVPKIILGEEPLLRLDSIRLYDKVSERDFPVKNKFSFDDQENILITFTSDEPTAELEVNVPEDKSIWSQGSEVSNLRNELFPNIYDPLTPSAVPADKQGLFEIDGEPVGFHDPSTNFPEEVSNTNFLGAGINFRNQPSASRSWGNQDSTEHNPLSELFEIDQDYQKAIAIIDFTPKIVGCFWGGKDFLNPTIFGGVCGAVSGNFWNVINRSSIDETDARPDTDSFQGGGGGLQFPIGSAKINDFFALEFERIGFEGEILKTTFESAFWGFIGTETAGATSADPDCYIIVKNRDGSLDIDQQNFFLASGSTNLSGETGFSFNWRIKDQFGTIPPFDSDSRFTLFEEINPSTGFAKVKFGGDITTSDLATIEEINSGRIGFQLVLDRAGADYDSRNIVDFLKFQFEARVDAESGLWFARGLGRKLQNGNLIDDSVLQLQNIFLNELKLDPNNFGTLTNQRQNWKSAFSIYGEQKEWRSVLSKVCESYGIASFQDREGKENLVDYDRRTPDFTITPEMFLLNGETQSISYNFTDREELFNEILIKYRTSPANGDTQAVLLINENEIQNTDSLEYLTTTIQGQNQGKAGKSNKKTWTSERRKEAIGFLNLISLELEQQLKD